MAVTLQQVRVEIGDEARWCTAPGLREVLTPLADGATSSYRLRFAKAILSSLEVWFGTTPSLGNAPSWTRILPGDATTPWTVAPDGNGWPVLTFAPTPPPALRMVAVRYLVVAFSDPDLSVYMANNVRADDNQTLKAIRFATIPVILNDPERLAVVSIGQRHEDVTAWVNAQLRLRDSLAKEIDPSSFGSSAYAAFGSGGVGSYVR